ncbi:MAG: helix-turn-helix domain-containing protein [Candidatus Dormibacteria bacterium]
MGALGSYTTLPRPTRLLDIQELAARLGISVSTARRYVEAGVIPAFQVGGPGGLVRIRESDLVRIMRQWEVRGGRR